MSRIGKQPVKIEDKVEVVIDKRNVLVKGPLGETAIKLPRMLTAKIEKVAIEGEEQEVDCVVIERENEEKQSKASHGTFRALIANAVDGVKSGYEKKLEIVGVGYRGKIENNQLVLSIGYTVPVNVDIPQNLEVAMPDELTITIKGIDKQKVNQYAAKIRSLKKPEPYKGKGIKYSDEVVRRKSAKTSIV